MLTTNDEVSQARPQTLSARNQARTAALLQDQERDRRVAERKRAPIDLPLLLTHSVQGAPRGGEWDSPSSSSSFPSTRHGGSGEKGGGGEGKAAMLTTENWPEIAVLSRVRKSTSSSTTTRTTTSSSSSPFSATQGGGGGGGGTPASGRRESDISSSSLLLPSGEKMMMEEEGGGFYLPHEEEEEEEGEEGGGATQPQHPHPLAHRTPQTVLMKRKAPTSPSFLRFQQDADLRLAKASMREEQLLGLGGGRGAGGGGEGGGVVREFVDPFLEEELPDLGPVGNEGKEEAMEEEEEEEEGEGGGDSLRMEEEDEEEE